MVRVIGDIWPAASGSSSLGIDQTACCPIGDEIRPFNHIHMNSGVWHDPLQGQSGIVRYSRHLSAFEASVDGGLTFDVLMTSGQIDTGHSIERAYVGGNEMHPPLNGEAYQGIVILEPTPLQTIGGLDGFDDHKDPVEGHTTFGFAISGAPPLPTTTSSLLRMGSHWMHMRSSGLAFQTEITGCFLGFESEAGGVFQIAASGAVFIEAKTGGIDLLTSTGDIDITAGSNIQNQASGFISMLALVGNFEYSAGFNIAGQATNDVLMDASFGNVHLGAYANSGQLEWRFGPYQAWHVNPSTNGDAEGPLSDGFFPMPHSGQIIQMIREEPSAVTLQQAYLNGNTIFPEDINDGAVAIQGDATSYGLFLSQIDDGHPHLLVSGVMSRPGAGLNAGAMWLQGHTAGNGTVQLQGGTQPANRAEASAKSLGIDTWFMDTGGSGIVSLRAASGVSQFFNVGASATIDENGTLIPLSLETSPSTFYHVNATSGIQIYVPGFYKISYVTVLNKLTGNLAQQVETELRVRDKWGQEFRLLGSQSAAVVRDSNDLNFNTANGQGLADLHAGDSLVLFAEHTGTPPAGNTVIGEARRGNVIVEWIGPMSAGSITRQKV